jgi:formylglycine-generating enzyme required for sulfatase activity
MALSKEQAKQIHDALLDGYSIATLRQMVRFGMDMDLTHVAGGENVTDIVFTLVQWADRQHRVQELITAAVNANPTNPKLQTLQQAAESWYLSPPAGGEEPEPYKGLDFFDVGDADRFFGRDRLTAGLVAYLCDHHLLAVVGASGSGKSSVVRAGVVPALNAGEHLKQEDRRPAGSERWPVHIITPTAHPLKELAASLTQESESVTAQTTLMDDLVADERSLDLFVSRRLAQMGEGGSRPKRLLLVVDQFEELFTLCRNCTERKAFVDNLLTAAAPTNVTTVVLTLRADFYAHCAKFGNLRQALESCQRYIGAMSEEELRLAVEAPAAQGGWDLEPGLVDLMLHDVSDESGALPLLSHALLETWKRRSGRTLTFAGYQASGRVQGAIAKTADSTFASLSPSYQTIAKNIFLRLTELGEGVQDTRRRVRLEELVPGPDAAPDVLAVLQALQSARLLTTVRQEARMEAEGESAPLTYVDVAHEALIREWPSLREWLAEDREGLRIHRRLTEVAQEWIQLGRDPGALYRGLRLEQTQAWAAEHVGELNEQERTFLEVSQALLDAELQEKERIEREREEARRRQVEQVQALAAEAEARRRAEEERAENAEQLAQEQVLRNQEQAEAAKSLAHSARRLRITLAVVGVVMLLAIGTSIATGIFFRQAQDNYAMAQDNYAMAQQRLDQMRVVLGVDLAANVDARRQVATLLVQFGEEQSVLGNDRAATEMFQRALDLDPPSDTPVYVWIPPGEFLMGSDPEVDSLAFAYETPQHTVHLDGFWIMRTEVTNEQYARCVEADACTPPGNDRWHREESAREPVTHVDWYQASAYAAWVGGRLPTEAEWEKACRGQDGRIYPWGNEDPELAQLNYWSSGLNGVVQVGSYPPGANGLFDMAGNVWEWTSSKLPPWEDAEVALRMLSGVRKDPEVRTWRGGSWGSDERTLRCAHRLGDYPLFRYDNVGFRVVSSPGS